MDYYDCIAEGYDELHRAEQLKKLEIIRDELHITKEDRLLDVGCGTGISTEFWDCKATGIDPSQGLLDQNKEKKAEYLKGKAEALPFHDSEFDVVISVTAIQNFDDFRKGLDEMKRVGKERFAFTVLKRSKDIEKIRDHILKNFNVKKIIAESKDEIFIIYR